MKIFNVETRTKKAWLLLYGILTLGFFIIPFLFHSFSDEDRIVQLPKDNEARVEDSKEDFALVEFDPNRVSAKDLQDLGLPEGLSERWVKYRESIGGFASVEDLSKLYGMEDSMLTHLANYMHWEMAERSITDLERQSEETENTVAHEARETRLFSFDPNSISKDSLIILGLSPGVAQTLVNYRNKGAVFYDIDDLLPVYGVEESWLMEREKYLNFPKKSVEKNSSKTYAKAEQKRQWKQKPPTEVDINVATASEFQEIYGIGPVFSECIVNFRNSLGGFHSKEQIAEVYGITDSLFTAISPQLKLSEVPLAKLKLNYIDDFGLQTHPYIDKKTARILTAYRNQHGVIEGLESMRGIREISEEWIDKISPYLDFNYVETNLAVED